MTLHPDGETVTLDPIPAADNPLVRNARVAADVLFRDPPPAYVVTVYEDVIRVQGDPSAEFEAWAARHHLQETNPHDGWRRWVGVIEGVQLEATCAVTA